MSVHHSRSSLPHVDRSARYVIAWDHYNPRAKDSPPQMNLKNDFGHFPLRRCPVQYNDHTNLLSEVDQPEEEAEEYYKIHAQA